MYEQIRPLTQAEYMNTAQSALRQVFSTEDPFGTPFAPDATARVVLYPYAYEMSPDLSAVVQEAARAAGDTGFFYSVTGSTHGAWNEPYHWYIPFTDMTAYARVVGPYENVVYSPYGRWAILASHENHGLLGGTDVVVSQIVQHLPTITHQVHDFIEAWKTYHADYGTDLAWLATQLRHVYGLAPANLLLKEHHLLYDAT